MEEKDFNKIWTKKQNELHQTYKYDIGTIVICVLLVVFCIIFWLLFIKMDMFNLK